MESIRIPLDDDGHLVDPPIIDSLRADPSARAFVSIFIPSDDVSASEKEQVVINRDSEDGRAISGILSEIAKLLKSDQPIISIIHGGGGNFVFTFDGGERRELVDGPIEDVSTSMDVYSLLQPLSQRIEIAFRTQINALKPRRLASGG